MQQEFQHGEKEFLKNNFLKRKKKWLNEVTLAGTAVNILEEKDKH